ncbi:MAG TPA: 50S ribosomal protein L9 [Thermodesulfobium narugense]|uniref:Large ribosomal subunit protein bL9 n=1 Tax=Thermodesulfobium acidiphilum TaxID=1794699 RepID=A0A2R4VYU8_THEAF|nr:50S ribosomal protein L9 [Thermodesulfobium acidiphilum]AWB09648.1 large subunit ribosomal protein L9 [Thermodesulfobium acidiphilum]PMP85518.1 MAG: 50S ribosomal protein L9 [Thermodesulfobium narugense]HEM55932.1 50S ribosomal protein L9 [Thermodesulfobium narugense]
MDKIKVLLIQDIKSLGKAGDIVEVSQGYARNYLFLKNLAKEATKPIIEEYEKRKIANKKKEDKKLAEAKNISQKLSSTNIVIKARMGENNKFYGAITSKDISNKLKEMGFDFDPKQITFEGAKVPGEYEAKIRVYPGVFSVIKLTVEGVLDL